MSRIINKSGAEEGADRVEIFSDDDDDFSSPEEGSDSEPMLDDQVSTRRLMSVQRKARGKDLFCFFKSTNRVTFQKVY